MTTQFETMIVPADEVAVAVTEYLRQRGRLPEEGEAHVSFQAQADLQTIRAIVAPMSADA